MKKEVNEIIDKCISELVYDKKYIKKAYNYYHGLRDPEQFKYLEDNYGIGTPTSITFNHLIKKHIDVLVGEYLELEPELSVSCKDKKTISNILRDKQLKIDIELYNKLKSFVENSILNIFGQGEQKDPLIEQELITLEKDLNKSFVSDYETAAYSMLTYFRQARDIDLQNKMRDLFTDLLVTGTCYYKVRPGKDKFDLEILNPIDTFIERNMNEFYLNKSSRAVVRKFLTKEQVIERYKHVLDKSIIAEIYDGNLDLFTTNGTEMHIVSSANTGVYMPKYVGGMLAGRESQSVRNLIEVYEVEWLEYDKTTETIKRQSALKIGGKIYVELNSEEEIVDASTNKDNTTLTVNGMFFLDKNGAPFSLMLSTSDLQDKYDMLIFYRDNLIANSGTVGDWIDIAHLPTILGASFDERIAKWQAYKKNGAALFNSSQEGMQQLNTTFNGFDDTIKAPAIQAIQLAIESIEMQAASITGVFPEKLGGIQQRDAVSNVKVGLKYSTLLTKQYFNAMDLMYKEVNYDMLNIAKIVYPRGIKGVIVLGNKLNKIFEALPKHYTVTDFDIHIKDSTENIRDRENIQAMSGELVKAGLVDPGMIIEILTTKNLTDLKHYVNESLSAKKEENNQLQQLSQQLEQAQEGYKQLEQQAKQLQEQLNIAQQQLKTNSIEKLNLEKKRLELEERKLADTKDFHDKTIETKHAQIQAEIAEFYDASPYNDKIKKVI